MIDWLRRVQDAIIEAQDNHWSARWRVQIDIAFGVIAIVLTVLLLTGFDRWPL